MLRDPDTQPRPQLADHTREPASLGGIVYRAEDAPKRNNLPNRIVLHTGRLADLGVLSMFFTSYFPANAS